METSSVSNAELQQLRRECVKHLKLLEEHVRAVVDAGDAAALEALQSSLNELITAKRAEVSALATQQLSCERELAAVRASVTAEQRRSKSAAAKEAREATRLPTVVTLLERARRRHDTYLAQIEELDRAIEVEEELHGLSPSHPRYATVAAAAAAASTPHTDPIADVGRTIASDTLAAARAAANEHHLRVAALAALKREVAALKQSNSAKEKQICVLREGGPDADVLLFELSRSELS